MKSSPALVARLNPMLGFLAVIVVIIILQDTLSESVRAGQLLSADWRGVFALALTNRIWTFVKILVLVPAVLMVLQAAFSLVIIVVLAGRAQSILR